MTTASKITLARIGLIPFFMVAALVDFNGHDYVALGIFILASATDGLDGYIARKYNQVSDFGKFIDPIADKLLVTSALLIFVERGQIGSWACFIVIAREFLVSGLRMVASDRGKVIAAAVSGKIKTAASILCICVMLLPAHELSVLPWLTLDTFCVFIILVTTVYSGIEYFIVNRSVLK